MATQVQLRGANTATQSARTLAVREPDIDTVKKRLYVHDGLTSGGIAHANFMDIQENNFIYATASGTNALTATYAPQPGTLKAGMEFIFLAANTNTGAVTLNPNGLGATAIKKLSGASKVALSAGDIVSGIPYRVTHDGTDFLLVRGGGGGLVHVLTTEISGTPSTLNFSDLFEEDKSYFVEFEDVKFTNATTLRMRVEQGGSFTDENYKYNGYRKGDGFNTNVASSINGAGYVSLVVDAGSSTAGYSVCGILEFFNPNNASFFCRGRSDFNYHASGGDWTALDIDFCQESVGAVTGFQLFPSSGNFIAGGKIHVYERSR